MRTGIFFSLLFIVLDPVKQGGEYPQLPFKSCRPFFALASLPPRDCCLCQSRMQRAPSRTVLSVLCGCTPTPVHTAGPCTHDSVRGLRSLHALGKDAELLCSPSRSCTCKLSLWTHRKFCLTLACWQTLRFSADIAQVIGLNSL